MNPVSKTVMWTSWGLFLAAGLIASAVAEDLQEMISTGPDNVAIEGYDTVAYFTEGRAMKGSERFTYSWRDAEWHFAHARHRDMFAADPGRYAPQFGGFCAGGMSKGRAVAADPEAWTIVDGKLYMKFNEEVRDRWRQDKAANIDKANEHWDSYQNRD